MSLDEGMNGEPCCGIRKALKPHSSAILVEQIIIRFKVKCFPKCAPGQLPGLYIAG